MLLSNSLLDVNFSYDPIRYRHTTLLCVAASYSSIDIVQLVLDKGAECDMTNVCRMGCTPLNSAAFKDRTNVAKMLLDAGADPNKADKYGHTPLFHASKRSLEMVKLLVNRGANCTSAYIARARVYGKNDIVKFLDGGDPEDQQTSRTPLSQ